MPRPPHCAPAVAQMSGTVFAPTARFDSVSRPAVPLHVGDTWIPPFEGGRMEEGRLIVVEDVGLGSADVGVYPR